MKNGITFTNVITQDQFQSGSWDPYLYRDSKDSELLSDYVKLSKLSTRGVTNHLEHAPIEYKDIPRGNFIGFNLKVNKIKKGRLPIVTGNTLLFGTMRAYLGNVLVTPNSEWVSESKSWFAINSEFLIVKPKDDLNYFWWAVLKSESFLTQLPTGTGGTRPRASIEQLNNIPIVVPCLENRKKINKELMVVAKSYWKQTVSLKETLEKTGLF